MRGSNRLQLLLSIKRKQNSAVHDRSVASALSGSSDIGTIAFLLGAVVSVSSNYISSLSGTQQAATTAPLQAFGFSVPGYLFFTSHVLPVHKFCQKAASFLRALAILSVASAVASLISIILPPRLRLVAYASCITSSAARSLDLWLVFRWIFARTYFWIERCIEIINGKFRCSSADNHHGLNIV